MKFKEFTLPDLGEGVTEGEIIKISVSPGDVVSMDQILVEVMTDKASMEVPSSIEGKVKEIKAKKGDMVAVGQVILTMETEGTEKETSKQKETTPSLKPKDEDIKAEKSLQENKLSEQDSNLAIPATRKLAEEFGVFLKDIPKQQDKVTRKNLIEHIKSSSGNSSQSLKQPPLKIEGGEIKRESLIGIKRIMFETMTLSKTTIPHFTITETANVTHLVKVRTKLKEKLKSQNIKLTYLPFFIKAILSGFKEFPIFNSSYDEQKKEVVYKQSAHIGFAVDTKQGLVVPVIKEAEKKSVLDITKEIQKLGEQAREGTIQRENLTGGSITLTNLGSIAGLSGTPIINPPEVAILGIYRMYQQIVKTETSSFEENPFINFSITCDHRLIDGATAARFLKSFISKVEEPSLLILD